MVNILIFPIADGKVKLSGGDQVLTTSTLIQDSLNEEENVNIFEDNRTDLQSHFKTYLWMTVKLGMISCPFQETFFR